MYIKYYNKRKTTQTKGEFQTKVCKLIAENKIRGNARALLLELAVNEEVKPVKQYSRSYNDSTIDLIYALKELGVPESKPSKHGNYYSVGYYMANDAPRGGKLGNIIKINFGI